VDHSHLTVADERSGQGAGAAHLTVTRVNPLEHGEAIKQLFLAHGRKEFPEFFERAYRDAVADGATSWIARNEEGRLCAHVARFHHTFRYGRRTVHGALLGNLMVATAYRTFWPALRLVRQVIEDCRLSGSLDFLYADPNEPSAAILQRTRFRPVGTLRRFVLPLNDQRRGVALGIRLYRLITRLPRRTMRLTLTERRASDLRAAPEPPEAEDMRSLSPVRGASLYRARLVGYPGPSDYWYAVHAGDSQDAPIGRALVRGPDSRGVAELCVLQCEPPTLLRSLLAALEPRLRQRGIGRLEAWLMGESPVAREARRGGFWLRHEQLPIFALPLTSLGAEVVAAGTDWRLLPIDLDR